MQGDIFVVEDDADDLELIRQAFTELGFLDTHYFPDAFQFLRYLKTKNEPKLKGLLVTDYSMPKIDGFNLVAYLKREEMYSAIDIVILTGTITEPEKKRLITTGVNKVYLKPSSFEQYKLIALELVNLDTSKAKG